MQRIEEKFRTVTLKSASKSDIEKYVNYVSKDLPDVLEACSNPKIYRPVRLFKKTVEQETKNLVLTIFNNRQKMIGILLAQELKNGNALVSVEILAQKNVEEATDAIKYFTRFCQKTQFFNKLVLDGENEIAQEYMKLKGLPQVICIN